jgi:hypothetical protein
MRFMHNVVRIQLLQAKPRGRFPQLIHAPPIFQAKFSQRNQLLKYLRTTGLAGKLPLKIPSKRKFLTDSWPAKRR